MPLSDFSVLFKTNLIFKDFSRKPSKFKYFSRLCEPWNLSVQILIRCLCQKPFDLALFSKRNISMFSRSRANKKWASLQENLTLMHEKQKHRPACTSVHSDSALLLFATCKVYYLS